MPAQISYTIIILYSISLSIPDLLLALVVPENKNKNNIQVKEIP